MGKEKMVDLKPKVDKISDEHLKELQGIVNIINNVQFNVGKIEMQNTLSKEYGSFDVNVNDGTINWPKEGEDEK